MQFEQNEKIQGAIADEQERAHEKLKTEWKKWSNAIDKLKDKLMQNQQQHSTSMNNIIDDLLKERRRADKAQSQSNTAQRKAEREKEYADVRLEKLKVVESSLANVKDAFVKINNELKETQDQEINILPLPVIKCTCKVGSKHPSWSHDIVQLIIELLVHGAPPSSIPGTFVSFIKVLSPSIKIKQLPSVWFIRRVRTIMLSIVEILAAYCLAKAITWGQLHTDMTTAYQTPFLNLLISYKDKDDDEECAVFKTLLISTCIFPVDESSLAQVEAITSFIEEKGKWLEKWASKCKKMYPDYDHDIPPASELTLAKLGDGGIVSTDTCNAAQKVNGMLIEKIKLEFGQRMRNQTIGEIIVGAVEDTITRAIQDDEDDTLEALAAQHSNSTPEDGNVFQLHCNISILSSSPTKCSSWSNQQPFDMLFLRKHERSNEGD